ncbi:MAG: type II toxin-antitoxin system VapB family antitoxin [Ruminococcus sp.]|nr:type II toxin-antitoxin system VapB family antitoxin [Ruminococcus sp.]MCM1381125.1 type II toxin-antitoxin system VapB family antitoxin [Muribaculaceae bacterium]MCM1478088.1 type II toxin-antitoxin system VapB family antitoxin [Muribaculaceae bacterium]
MQTAKLFLNGGSQAVRLPKEFRFGGNEVYAQKVGETVILVPKDKAWETFIEGINGFTEDYFEAVETRRGEEFQTERETL